MSDENQSEREKLLLAEARACLISADILEEGFFSDLFSGFASLLGSEGSIIDMLSGEKGGNANYNLKVGDLDTIRLFADKAAVMPRKSEEIKTVADKGMKIVKDAISTANMSDDQRDFFKMAIEDSAKKIAAAQEEEVKKITSALSKQDLPDNVIKTYAGIIVPAALLGALKTNLS